MNNLKLNARKISLILSMSLGMSLVGGCSNKNIDKSVVEIVDEVKDFSCVDEVIGDEDLLKIDRLLEYIELSKMLNDLKIENIDVDLEQFRLLSPYEIKKLIAVYTNKKASKYLTDGELSLVKTDLSVERQLVNNYILESGYYISEAFLIDVLKSEILDAKGLDKSSYNSFTISSEEDSLVDSMTSNFWDYIYLTKDIKTSDKAIVKALKSLYRIQGNEDGNSKENTSYEYNPDRNRLIKTAINNGKDVIPKKYTLKKGYLKKKGN